MKKIVFLLLVSVGLVIQGANAANAANAAKAKSSKVLLAELVTCLEEGRAQANSDLEKLDPDEAEGHGVAKALVSSYDRALLSLKGMQATSPGISMDAYSSSISRVSYIQTSLPEECSALYIELKEAIDREKREAYRAFAQELSAFQLEIGEALLKARAPEELDTFYARVEEMKGRANQFRSSSNSGGYDFRNTTNNLTQIISGWQDYLNNLLVGDKRQAESSLRNLSNRLTTTPVLPRSKVLQMQNELKLGVEAAKRAKEQSAKVKDSSVEPEFTLLSVIAGLRTVEDLQEAKEKLEVLRGYQECKSSAEDHLRYLSEFNLAMKLIESGSPVLAVNAAKRGVNSGRGYQWTKLIQADVIEHALLAAIPDRFHRELKGQGVESMFAGVAQQLNEDGAWQDLWGFLVLTESFLDHREREQLGINKDKSALEHFMYAQRLEKTGQLSKALSSYNSCMRSTGPFGPYDEAAEGAVRINKMQADELKNEQEHAAKTARPVVYARGGYPYSSRHQMFTGRQEVEELMKNEEFKELLAEAIARQVSAYLLEDASVGDDEGAKEESKE